MRFCYINKENIYPQDRHIIDGLRELGHGVYEVQKKSGQRDAIIVGFTSPLSVIYSRFFTSKKIIFNATFSQYEANIISRKGYGFLGIKTAKWWLIDFLSFHLSTKILLESDAQRDFISRFFFVSKKKLIKSYSGLNEKEFFYDPNIKKYPKFTVLFRGRFLPESGILTVIEAAKKLENSDVRFLIIGHGFMYREFNALMAKLQPKNVEHIHDRLPVDKLRELMLSCHISLGQLAVHPRLDRTIPCKLFESLALGLPYLTGRNKAIFEILEENKNCIVVNQGDSNDLARKILELKDDRKTLDRIGKAGYDLYKQKLTSKKLAEDFIDDCLK